MIRRKTISVAAYETPTARAVAAHRLKRRARLLFALAAAAVVLLVAYALALPAVTMEGLGDATAEDVLLKGTQGLGGAEGSVGVEGEGAEGSVGAAAQDMERPGSADAQGAQAAGDDDGLDGGAQASIDEEELDASRAVELDVSGAVELDDGIETQDDARAAQSASAASDPSVLDGSGYLSAIGGSAGQGDASSNEWQIVSEEYAGNQAENKALSSDGKVRVQKNVMPTNVENEFLVYLSIDTKQLFRDFFASAEYRATTSNKYHDSDLGTVVTSMAGDQNVKVTGNKSAGYGKSATFSFLSSAGELLADNIILYWDHGNNGTFYLVLGDGRYMLTGLSVKSGESNVVMLSEEAERLIMSNVAQMASLNAVTDVMGDYVEYLGVVGDNYGEDTSYDKSSRTLTWLPQLKANPEIDKVRTDESKTVTWTDHDGNERVETVYSYTSWALNVAELVYKVRLCTEKEGFQSAANNMSSGANDACSYAVNESAILTYDGTSTVGFPQPYVRGLLYNLPIAKVDEKDKPLAGAAFELAGVESSSASSSLLASPIAATSSATSGEDGLVKFTGLVGRDGKYAGEFQLRESIAPAGYAPLSQSVAISLGNYTSLGGDFFVADADGNMLRKASSSDGTNLASGLITSQGSYEVGTVDVDGNFVPVVKIPNTKAGYRLPDTGGPGTAMLTAGGLLVLATCLLYRCHVQTRRRREGN